MRAWYDLTGADIFVQKTPTTFDVSVGVVPAVHDRRRTVIAEPGRHGDADHLPNWSSAVDLGDAPVPSMLAAFVDALGADRLAALTSAGGVHLG